jgi:hypothetical protein
MSSEAKTSTEESLNEVFLLQRSVFEAQSNSLTEYLSQTAPIVLDGALKVPRLLLDRHLPDELKKQGRLLDNEEVTIHPIPP